MYVDLCQLIALQVEVTLKFINFNSFDINMYLYLYQIFIFATRNKIYFFLLANLSTGKYVTFS